MFISKFVCVCIFIFSFLFGINSSGISGTHGNCGWDIVYYSTVVRQLQEVTRSFGGGSLVFTPHVHLMMDGPGLVPMA